MRRSMVLAPLLLLASPGCSFVWDGNAPDLPLVGNPPDMSKFPRLNKGLVTGYYFVLGKDNAVWLAMEEKPNLRLVRTSPPEQEQVFVIGDTKKYAYVWRTFYFFPYDPAFKEPTVLNIQAAASTQSEIYTMPPGPPLLLSAGADSVFLYWPKLKTTTSFQVVHRVKKPGDTPLIRTIPVPEGIDPENPSGMFFNGDGSKLFTRDKKGNIKSWSTVDTTGMSDVEYGIRPVKYLDEGRKNLITLGMDGFRFVPLNTKDPDFVIDPTPCEQFITYPLYSPTYYLTKAGEIRKIALDGKTPYEVIEIPGMKRLLGFAPDSRIIYSKDRSDRYIYGSGDGWVGDWRIMERGLYVTYSRDAQRVRWLEHTALTGGSGELLSATVPNGVPIRLGRNVHAFSELSDGRLLTVANRAYTGTQNRIIVIDEVAGQARWVADNARDYSPIPGSTDLLVDVVTGATGRDLVRVPIPPMPCEDIAKRVQFTLDGSTACKEDKDCRLVGTACGLPSTCGAYRAHWSATSMPALIESWKTGKCAPMCEPCPKVTAVPAACIDGKCAPKVTP